jgi:hypothetical protein
MSTTHDDNATTWRDLVDQLTPKQVDGFESMERRFAADGIGDQPQAKAALLEYAREYVEGNLVDRLYADVPLPAGASTDSEGWAKDLKRGGYRRSLVWRSFGERANVEISGWQHTDGSFSRHICLWGVDEGGSLTSAHARHIAALLVEAADEMERLQ